VARRQYWLENLSHTVVLILGILMAVYFYDYLDKVLALCGSVLGTSVVLLTPSLCHYKIVAKNSGSSYSRVVDILIAAYASFVLVFCTGQVIYGWAKGE